VAEFDNSIRQVSGYLDRAGLGRLFRSVRGIRAVRQESFHDVRTFTIGLNPRDVRKPFAAFHRRPYLLIHELGHHFVETRLGRRDRKRLEPIFGSYDAPTEGRRSRAAAVRPRFTVRDDPPGRGHRRDLRGVPLARLGATGGPRAPGGEEPGLPAQGGRDRAARRARAPSRRRTFAARV